MGIGTFSDISVLLRLATDLAARPDLPELLPATPGTRTWRSLDTAGGCDAWLIAWPEGTDTGWHDHQGSAGVFTVAAGTLTELSVPGGRPAAVAAVDHGHAVASWIDVRTRRYSAGQSRTFGSRHIHHVMNEDITTAYSVHIYSPLLRGMSRYEWQDADLVLTGDDAAGSWQG